MSLWFVNDPWYQVPLHPSQEGSLVPPRSSITQEDGSDDGRWAARRQPCSLQVDQPEVRSRPKDKKEIPQVLASPQLPGLYRRKPTGRSMCSSPLEQHSQLPSPQPSPSRTAREGKPLGLAALTLTLKAWPAEEGTGSTGRSLSGYFVPPPPALFSISQLPWSGKKWGRQCTN